MALNNRSAVEIYIQHLLLNPDKTILGLGDLASVRNCFDSGRGVFYFDCFYNAIAYNEN